ncbi:MAG TPA: D-alanine--D-alanine ligase [Gemmatimonadaceae bacterium]|nr:D-alanine--D-alanine ligase [Gemmatimonadaceae bacterium]
MRITVLLGGTSAERDVSLASGSRVIAALRERGHTVTAVDPARGVMTDAAIRDALPSGVQRAWPTQASLARLRAQSLGPALGMLEEVRGADVVFNALHGGEGENGTTQAILDAAGVRYTGSGALGSAIAMDKDLSKILFRAAGVPTADWRMIPVDESRVIADLGLPLIVKPSKQGSTVGLTLLRDATRLREAIALAQEHDDEVMLERFIPGRELTVGVLGDTPLPVGEIIPKNELYDYEAKYTAGMAREIFPAPLSPSEAQTVQQHALHAFRALKLRGYARIDFRMMNDGTFYCLEANTNPGLTDLSLIPQAAAAAGIAFPDLCDRIAQLAASGRGSGEGQ